MATKARNWEAWEKEENMKTEKNSPEERRYNFGPSTDRNMQNDLALEGIHGESFKKSWLLQLVPNALACLCLISDKRGENKNMALDTQETQDHDIQC